MYINVYTKVHMHLFMYECMYIIHGGGVRERGYSGNVNRPPAQGVQDAPISYLEYADGLNQVLTDMSATSLQWQGLSQIEGMFARRQQIKPKTEWLGKHSYLALNLGAPVCPRSIGDKNYPTSICQTKH